MASPLRRALAVLLTVGTLVLLAAPLAAEPLVRMQNDNPVPALASGFEVRPEGVVFTFVEPRAGEVRLQLLDKIPGTNVRIEVVDPKTLRISGVSANRLFRRLASIDIRLSRTLEADGGAAAPGALAMAMPDGSAAGRGDDPFGGEGPAGLQVPDGSASIRASSPDNPLTAQPGGTPAPALPAAEPDVAFGQVLEVIPGQFPNVVIRLRVLVAPTEARLSTLAPAGAEVRVAPFFRGNPYVNSGNNHRNLGAFFVLPGDRVACQIARNHAPGDGPLRCELVRRVP